MAVCLLQAQVFACTAKLFPAEHVSWRGRPAAKSTLTSSTGAGWAEGEQKGELGQVDRLLSDQARRAALRDCSQCQHLGVQEVLPSPCGSHAQVALGRSLLVSEAFIE